MEKESILLKLKEKTEEGDGLKERNFKLESENKTVGKQL